MSQSHTEEVKERGTEMKKQVTIQAVYKGIGINRIAYTQQQANIIINQLA